MDKTRSERKFFACVARVDENGGSEARVKGVANEQEAQRREGCTDRNSREEIISFLHVIETVIKKFNKIY